MSFVITEKNELPTLCLNMIVKNESKIIERMLSSVLPIIDTYCICDTGSTDNTVEVIKTFFKKNNIPGKVVNEPFKDFAHNRNFALKSCSGMSHYVLLMDADMKLQVGPNFDKKKLFSADSFCLLQGDEAFYYQNVRIVKNNGLFDYFGVTHEYVNTPNGTVRSDFKKDELFILDIGDGGSKGDKFERDIRLLTKGIEDDPKNDRYHFYLANSYHDSGKYEKAIEYYKKRIELGGWEQEIWYSYYRIGFCHKYLGRTPEAIYAWLDGYNKLPVRLENLYEIVHHYRNEGKNKSAMMFYNLCMNNLNEANKHKDGYLFLHNDVYTYKLFYEYTIIAAYNGITNIDNEVVKVFNHCGDYNIVSNILSNMKFYKHILKTKENKSLSVTIDKMIGNREVKMYSSSASIIKNPWGKGYSMNIRLVNYRIDEWGNYLDCEKNIITTNKFIQLDDDLNQVGFERIFDVKDEDRLYLGIEDIRIYQNREDKGKLDFIGTGYHKDNKLGIVIGDYDIAVNILEGTEIKCSFSDNSCEKNWVFFDYKDSTHIVYKWSPLQICKIDKQKCLLDLVEERKTMPKIFNHVRGSTCGFSYKDEVWFIVHLVSYEKPRHYYHMYVVFDKNMNLLRYSAPFKFEGICIEYCLGLVVEDERVIVPYSYWDNKTKLAVYDKSYIESLLVYK